MSQSRQRRTSRSLWQCVILAFTCLLATNTSAEQAENSAAKLVGLDAAKVEKLALYFAEESVRRLHIPFTQRVVAAVTGEKLSRKDELEKVRANPPRADERGVVYPFGKSNPLSFVYNANKGTMVVWERFIKKRGSVGYYGLTAVELAVALNKSTSREKDRAEADFAWDPLADALSLRREYTHVPVDRDVFYQQVDDMVSTQLRWMEKERFLHEATAAAERHAPQAEASAESDGFSATMTLRHFSVYPTLTQFYVGRYVKTWNRGHGVKPPLLVSDNHAWAGQALNAFIHFQGASNSPLGKGDVTALFRLTGPDGNTLFHDQKVQIWQTEVPPPTHLQLGLRNLAIPFAEASPAGDYALQAQVCDQVSKRCVELMQTFALQAR